MKKEHSSNENTINDWYTQNKTNKHKINRIMRGRVKKIWNYFCFLELNGCNSSSHTQFTEEDFSFLQRNLVFHQFTCIEINKTPSSIHLRRIESKIPCQIGTVFFNRHSSLPTLFKLEMFSKIVNLVSMNRPLNTCFTFEF